MVYGKIAWLSRPVGNINSPTNMPNQAIHQRL